MICVGGFDFMRIPFYDDGMTTPLAGRIRSIRITLGLDQAEFGERLGVGQSTVARWEKGSTPKIGALQSIAELARTTVESLTGIDELSRPLSNAVPIVGYVGAGASVLTFDDYSESEPIGYVERPAFIDGRAVAVEVQGDSLFPMAENGWKLIYAGEQTLIEADILNRLCVVCLVDGSMLVKRVIRGSTSGRYHLLSTNAPMIEDAQVQWAARVKAIIPT